MILPIIWSPASLTEESRISDESIIWLLIIWSSFDPPPKKTIDITIEELTPITTFFDGMMCYFIMVTLADFTKPNQTIET